MDAGPSTPYYKLTGELKTYIVILIEIIEWLRNFEEYQFNLDIYKISPGCAGCILKLRCLTSIFQQYFRILLQSLIMAFSLKC